MKKEEKSIKQDSRYQAMRTHVVQARVDFHWPVIEIRKEQR